MSHERKGNLKKTRADHIAEGSSSPIPPQFSSDVPWGLTLSEGELREYYVEQSSAIRKIADETPEERERLLRSGISGLVDGFAADLDTLQARGIEVEEARGLIQRLRGGQ